MGAELRNRLSWSHSRNETFRDCLRRYYYHYYGSWGGWSATAPPEARRLYLLKNLKNRHLWAGGIVHDAAAEALAQQRKAPAPPPDAPQGEAAAGRAVERMRREFRLSRSGAYREDPRRVVGLTEHHYSEPVADAVWQETAEMVRRSLLNFYAGSYLRDAGKLPAEDWLALEDLQTFPCDGVPVYVKMDLAWRRPDGGVRILDWKTGRRRPQPGGLQLAVYALYATEQWEMAPEQIELREINLNLDCEAQARPAAADLEAARAEIRASLDAMRARLTDVAENEADIAEFPAEPNARRCRGCPFREACPEYQEAEG
jgi:hypothetical protein